MHGTREPLNRADVPFYAMLAEEMKYSWLDNFIRWEQNLGEVNRLKQELREVNRTDPTFSEFAERVRGSYTAYRQKRIEAIAKYLYKGLASPDPLQRFHRAMAPERLDVLPLDVLEEALSYLEANYQGGITSAEKLKQIAAIEKKIAKLENEMAALLPPEQFETRHPQSNATINKAEAFTDHWRNLATWTKGAVSPRGRVLRLSPEPEQKAFYALGLDRLASRAARLEPFPE